MTRRGVLDGQSRMLLDAVFHEQDQLLLQAFRDRMRRSDQRAQLAEVCGVHDEALLDHLLDLGVQPEALAAIAVVPLIVVAWSDRKIQAEERGAILRAAEASGIPPKDGRYPVLEHWLAHEPEPELLRAWKLYVSALCRQLSPAEVEELKSDLLNRASDVAQAAGGVLGIGNKVSRAERATLDELAQAFD